MAVSPQATASMRRIISSQCDWVTSFGHYREPHIHLQCLLSTRWLNMCHVISIFLLSQPVNRVKVFLGVTCSSEVNVCWSERWMAVRVAAGMQWQQPERQRDKYTCTSPRHHRVFPHGRHQLRVTTCQLRHFLPRSRKRISQTSAWVSAVGFFFCGTGSLEGISQLLGGGICRYFPQLTVQESTKRAIKTVCLWSVEAA